jgi:hypothetical protein
MNDVVLGGCHSRPVPRAVAGRALPPNEPAGDLALSLAPEELR